MTCYMTRCYQACDYSHSSSKDVEGAKAMILEGIYYKTKVWSDFRVRTDKI